MREVKYIVYLFLMFFLAYALARATSNFAVSSMGDGIQKINAKHKAEATSAVRQR